MKLPMSVVMTSSVPERSLRYPGQSAQSAPPAMPARKDAGSTTAADAPPSRSVTKAAEMAPI